MKKNTFLILLGLLLVTFSCRTETEITEASTEKNETAKRFYIFPEKEKSSMHARVENFDYANTFAFLAQKSDSIHEANFTGLVNTSNKVIWNENLKQNFITEASEPYIEFRIHSDIIFEENNDKWMVFPKMENNLVIDLIAATLTEEDTKLHYYDIDRNSDFYLDNVSLFQELFNNSVSASTNSFECGRPGLPPCDIQEVVITYPSPIVYIPPSGINSMGGGCGYFFMCPPDDTGGGGSGSSPILELPNPCDKIKKVGKNQKTKDLMKNNLKPLTTDTKEHGYVLNENNGNINENYFQGPQGEPFIDVPLMPMDGFIHSHFNSLGLSVPSLGDIFATAYLYSNGYVNNTNTFVVGVVTSSSQYLIIIDDSVKLGNFANTIMNGNQINQIAVKALEWAFQNTYDINQNNNLTTNQEKFVDFLKDNNTGLKLIKVSDDYNTYNTLNQDSSGNVIPQNCP